LLLVSGSSSPRLPQKLGRSFQDRSAADRPPQLATATIFAGASIGFSKAATARKLFLLSRFLTIFLWFDADF
jgi:hypothetical protein